MIYNRGWSYAQQGDYKSAINDYTKCISLQPDLAKAFNSRGNAHFNSGMNCHPYHDHRMDCVLMCLYHIGYL